MDGIDQVLRALAEPTRRSLVELLCTGPQTVSALAARLDTTLSATVQHLAVLEECGLVRSEKRGRVRTCYLRPKALRQAESWFAKRREHLERSFDRLESYLKQRRDLDD